MVGRVKTMALADPLLSCRLYHRSCLQPFDVAEQKDTLQSFVSGCRTSTARIWRRLLGRADRLHDGIAHLGQAIQAHPHVHVMVTGGALTKTNSGYKWKAGKKTYMLPATEFSADFRMAFCTALRKLWKAGQLVTQDGQFDVEKMLEKAKSKDLEGYIQTPKGEVRNLLDYLGRYVFRIAISNHRILKVARGLVTFEYYDNRDNGKLKVMTLSAVEFIRRFLLHVLPKSFQRIRHYGLHHSSQQKKLLIARKLLGLSDEKPKIELLKMAKWLKDILQVDPDICPFCGQGKMVLLSEFSPTKKWRLMFAPLVAKIYSWSSAY
jgi:hypothetical protein